MIFYYLNEDVYIKYVFVPQKKKKNQKSNQICLYIFAKKKLSLELTCKYTSQLNKNNLKLIE